MCSTVSTREVTGLKPTSILQHQPRGHTPGREAAAASQAYKRVFLINSD